MSTVFTIGPGMADWAYENGHGVGIVNALREYERLIELLEALPAGFRVVVGHDRGGEWFAAYDYPPPDDHGPMTEASTPLAAVLGLADMVLE